MSDRCGNCGAPSDAPRQRRHGYDCCDDCAALADSPFWARADRTHAFINGSGGWCFRCGVKRDDSVHMPGITGQVPSTTEGQWS